MARKPKTARKAAPATLIEEGSPPQDNAPAPARRGRKPKAAAAAPEPLAMMDSDDAAAGSLDAGGSVADPVAPPVRKRPGPKPKQRVEAAAALPQSVAPAKRGRKARTPNGEVGSRGSAPEIAAGDMAPAPPAAQWDPATDTVRFDWAEIERTASREGPNQGMAKLLIAARAEGANSRWPL